VRPCYAPAVGRLRAGPFLPLAATLLIAACGSVAPIPTELASPAPSNASASSPAGATPRGASGGAGTAAPTAVPSGTPPTARPAASAAAPSGSIDPTACAGTDANRAFYRDTAAAVAWDVYCPVLPKGWNVESGQYRGASGGTMTISYRTSAGLRLELREGSFCTGSAAECGPFDAQLGTAQFGDRVGQLGRFSGNLVLYVNPGSSPAWQATGVGLDEAAFRSICASFIKVPA
jgi:hypothetical protein